MMTFSRAVFVIAGIIGIMAVVLVRIPAAEDWSDHWISATLLSWQIVFLVIAWDPIRFRPVMLPAMLEKFLYVATVIILAVAGQIPAEETIMPPLIVHGAFGVLFTFAFVHTRPHRTLAPSRA